MSTTKKRTPRLGRGLSSLMAKPVAISPETPNPVATEAEITSPSQDTPANIQPAGETIQSDPQKAPTTSIAPGQEKADNQDSITYIQLDCITPNRHQPRQTFEESALKQLSESIQRDGVMQPITVRPVQDAKDSHIQYELVAGERRWRAAQVADIGRIPAIVRELDNLQMAEWALIENLQREDLNPIERAEAFAHLAQTFNLNHEQIAQKVGLDRSSVSNLMRLLNLCEFCRQLVRDNLISMGQARALVALQDPQLQEELAKQAVREGWSVRQTEAAVRKAGQGTENKPQKAPPKLPSPHMADLEQQLSEQLQTKIKIRPGKKKGSGSLLIEFYSLDEFDSLLQRLGVSME